MTDLAPFSFSGRFWRGNLHTHSNLSDGRLPPDKVVEAYKDAGYDFMMLSDHFLDRYGWPMADTRGMRSNRLTPIIGAELHAPETAVGELWHIVAAGLPLDFPPCPPDESGPALAERAAAAGAFVGIAHPAWSPTLRKFLTAERDLGVTRAIVSEAGAVDGVTARREATVDGLGHEVHGALIDGLRRIAWGTAGA
jgi:hypothetical protein